MGRINGVVFISGANRGVGLELTRALLLRKDVTKVYAGCRNIDRAEALQSCPDPDKKLQIVELDVTKDWCIKNAVAAITEECGHINVLINNAAILEKECLSLLRKAIANGGTATIVNISGRKGSIELCPGTERVHGNYAYMCSKTAVNHLTRILSIEHPDLLTVAMCPGWNRTDMGGPDAMNDPSETAPQLLTTVDRMTLEKHSGKFWDRNGQAIPY